MRRKPTIHRIAIKGDPLGHTTVEAGATVGAVLGVNLWKPDGTLVQLDDLAPAEPPDDDGLLITYWQLIQEIPVNVAALAATTTTGLYAITATGTSATRAIESSTLDVENGSGVAGNPRINDLVRRIAAEEVSALRLVYESAAGIAHLDPTVEAEVDALVGISISAGAAAAEIRVRARGTIDDPGWSWTPGLVFAGPDGTLTQTPPVSGWEIVVGYAPTATRLNLTFDEPVLLA